MAAAADAIHVYLFVCCIDAFACIPLKITSYYVFHANAHAHTQAQAHAHSHSNLKEKNSDF